MSNHANFRQNKQQTQELQSLSSSITTANDLQVSTNTKLDSLISSQGVLPSALTGSGNLKVCIQELGNEGSERLNVEVGDIAQFPTALTGSGNLKVSIQEEFNSGLSTASNQTAQTSHLNTLATASASQATASNQTTANGHLSTIASNTELKGFTDITDASSAVRLSADTAGKLQVNLLGSTNASGSTPHYHLTADSNGRLKVVDQYSTTITNLLTKSRVATRLTTVAGISANSGGTVYDLGTSFDTYATLKISADCVSSAPQDLYIQISIDGVNWNWKTGIGFVGANGGGYAGFFANTSIDQPLRYWRIFNNNSVASSPVLDTLMSIVSVE